jgi:hypothetical protein
VTTSWLEFSNFYWYIYRMLYFFTKQHKAKEVSRCSFSQRRQVLGKSNNFRPSSPSTSLNNLQVYIVKTLGKKYSKKCNSGVIKTYNKNYTSNLGCHSLNLGTWIAHQHFNSVHLLFITVKYYSVCWSTHRVGLSFRQVLS